MEMTADIGKAAWNHYLPLQLVGSGDASVPGRLPAQLLLALEMNVAILLITASAGVL
jgi:hypothetical protein